MFLSSCRNTSGSLGGWEMLWEHELQTSVSTAFCGPCSPSFSSFPKLSQVFLYRDRNTENMFSISFRKHYDEEKENNLLTIHQKVSSLCCAPSLCQQLVLVLCFHPVIEINMVIFSLLEFTNLFQVY